MKNFMTASIFVLTLVTSAAAFAAPPTCKEIDQVLEGKYAAQMVVMGQVTYFEVVLQQTAPMTYLMANTSSTNAANTLLLISDRTQAGIEFCRLHDVTSTTRQHDLIAKQLQLTPAGKLALLEMRDATDSTAILVFLGK